MKYSRLISAFFLFPVVLYLADYGTNVLGYAEHIFFKLGDGALLVHIAVLVLLLMHIMGKNARREYWGEATQLFYLGFLTAYSFLDERFSSQFLPLFLLVILVAIYYERLNKYCIVLSAFIMTFSGLFLLMQRGESFFVLTLSVYPALYVALVYQKNMRFREILDDREGRLNEEISYLRKQLMIKEENIAKLRRPQYYCECELTRTEKELLDSIRILKTINVKELARFMERAEQTIHHNINRVIKKLGLPGRVELFAYVMLSIPDITE